MSNEEQTNQTAQDAKRPSMSDLLPCPFCGRPATLDQFTDVLAEPKASLDYQVLCCDEDCYGWRPLEQGWETKIEAINAWNARAR